MIIPSLRINPFWREGSNYQIDGLNNLINFIKNKNDKLSTWLEIGSYIGESAEIFLSHNFIKKLYCVDTWELSNSGALHMLNHSHQKIIKYIFLKRMFNQIKNKRCIPIEGESLHVFQKLNQNFDVIYIDAGHGYKDVFLDLFHWYTKLNDDGFMCGHDFIFDKTKDEYQSSLAIQDFINMISPNTHGVYELHIFEDGSWAFPKKQILNIEEYKIKGVSVLNTRFKNLDIVKKHLHF